MPSHVIKRAPDKDEYLIWSTVVDHPTTYVMSRVEMREYLLREHSSDSQPEALADARLARADEHGSSAEWGFPEGSVAYGWKDDDTFQVTNCERAEHDQPDPWCEMDRERLFDHTKLDEAADSSSATAQEDE